MRSAFLPSFTSVQAPCTYKKAERKESECGRRGKVMQGRKWMRTAGEVSCGGEPRRTDAAIKAATMRNKVIEIDARSHVEVRLLFTRRKARHTMTKECTLTNEQQQRYAKTSSAAIWSGE